MDRLIGLLAEVRPEVDFLCSQDFVADGLLDSFDVVMLVSAIERSCGVRIDGAEIVPDNFRSLPALAALIRRHGGEP